ncbi:MAG: hypothetical protein QOH47_2608 [Sphingomonadales bacterium]|jgi:hypothetical protein|nr:hypothetical protein [Sphingomonadales bacterium]
MTKEKAGPSTGLGTNSNPSILRQAQDRRSPERAGRKRLRYVRFTRWRRRRFFALLAETGSVRLACEISGVGLGCIARLRRVEPGFVARMEAAVAAADARPARERARPAAGPEAGEGDLVIRRGIGGRLRAMNAGLHWWGARRTRCFSAICG